MQTELFTTAVPSRSAGAVDAPDPKPKPAPKKRAKREIVEPINLGFYCFETWIKFHAKKGYSKDGLRIRFSVPVHSDLLEAINNPEKTIIACKYRVRENFLWGGLGEMAEIRIQAYLMQGPRGGLYLHCKHVEILKPVKINKAEPLPRSIKKMIKSIQKLC